MRDEDSFRLSGDRGLWATPFSGPVLFLARLCLLVAIVRQEPRLAALLTDVRRPYNEAAEMVVVPAVAAN